MSAITAGVIDWRMLPTSVDKETMQQRYDRRWAFYTGEAFSSFEELNNPMRDPRIYRNTRLTWKHTESLVDFYAAMVYQGMISLDGKPLPDGSPGAIPFEFLDLTDEQIKNFRTMSSAIFREWNWRHQMHLRPMYGSALGDCFTELTVSKPNKLPMPTTIWPGYIPEIELDSVGNVKRFVLEYQVIEEHKTHTERYMYRKEVDHDVFKWFKDGEPFDYSEDKSIGTEMVNPYGFVPAVWDRHRIRWNERGAAATDGVRQALVELNSFMSHGLDFQRKAFFAPIIVSGQLTEEKASTKIKAPPRDMGSDLPLWINFLQASENATIAQVNVDVGQTLNFIQELREGILAENPEARVFHQMREMTAVTGPGADRLLGDSKAKLDLARGSYDTGTIKLIQMEVSMAAYHMAQGDWGKPAQFSARQKAFEPYSPDSYRNGELDVAVMDRPMIPLTEEERVNLVLKKETIQTPWGLQQIGMEKDAAEAFISERDGQMIGEF